MASAPGDPDALDGRQLSAKPAGRTIRVEQRIDPAVVMLDEPAREMLQRGERLGGDRDRPFSRTASRISMSLGFGQPFRRQESRLGPGRRGQSANSIRPGSGPARTATIASNGARPSNSDAGRTEGPTRATGDAPEGFVEGRHRASARGSRDAASSPRASDAARDGPSGSRTGRLERLACWALAIAAAYARARLLLRRAAVLGWRTRRAPALSILAVASLRSAAAFSKSLAATDAMVRFVRGLDDLLRDPIVHAALDALPHALGR